MITQTGITIETEKYSNGQLCSRVYRNEDGQAHRDPADGPAVEYFYENGALRSRQFLTNGRLHRPTSDGPACEFFYKDGQLSNRDFYVDDVLHRPTAEGPAYESFFMNGQILHRLFCVNGKRHRPIADGPAVERFYFDGKRHQCSFWIDGLVQQQQPLSDIESLRAENKRLKTERDEAKAEVDRLKDRGRYLNLNLLYP